MSDRITLEERKARLSSADGSEHVVDLREFINAIADHTVQGRVSTPLADNVRWVVSCGTVQVYIVELRPELRCVQWIADHSPVAYGPGAVTQPRTLATPYIILKIPFRNDELIQRVELFYRNAPLTALDGSGGELFFPNLLNVSTHAYHCISWFCTQYLAPLVTHCSVPETLDAVVQHLVSGSFNYSSEHSEGGSGFTLYRELDIDPRLGNVGLWEEASRLDPSWILTVPWKSANTTVGKLIDDELRHLKASGPPSTAAALGNILLRKTRASA